MREASAESCHYWLVIYVWLVGTAAMATASDGAVVVLSRRIQQTVKCPSALFFTAQGPVSEVVQERASACTTAGELD